MASFARLSDQKLDASAAPDSFNVLSAWLGKKTEVPGRDHLVLQGNAPNPLALRVGDWMRIEKGGAKANGPSIELYNLATDLSQSVNVTENEPVRAKAMSARLKTIRENGHSR